MKSRLLLTLGSAMLLGFSVAAAEAKVTAEHTSNGLGFRFQTVPLPAKDDAGSSATVTMLDGERDGNGGDSAVLHDGRLPADEDQPSAHFFFRAGTDGGRLAFDLGRVISVQQVNSYSWHPNTRAAQVYTLYWADGTASGFDPAPKRPSDPETCGWSRIASVDTRPRDAANDAGGIHGVEVANSSGAGLGRFRFLLIDIHRTEDRDAFGNTFYSEIDVVDADGPRPTPATSGDGEPVLAKFEAMGGRYTFTLDATAAPDLMPWAKAELSPIVQLWYPKLVEMLPSDGFVAATNLTLRFRNDLGGTPASAAGDRINLNSEWFRRQLQREARGSVVHEMVHVVQAYGRARRTNPQATRTPGWLVEGIADYIRWFLYEPETHGAEITERNLARAQYDASYRITGNFLNWVTERHDRELVRKLNAAARGGRYTEELWQDWTGKTLKELGAEWRRDHETRLKSPPGSDPGP